MRFPPFTPFRVFALALLLLSLFWAGHAQALEIRSIRLGQHPDKNRIVMEVDQITDFRSFSIQDPSRLVIDVPDFRWSVQGINKPAALALKDVRYGSLGAGLSRIVFEMTQPAIIQAAFMIPARDNQPNRLVLDYILTDAATAAKAANIMHGTMPAQVLTQAPASPSQPQTLGQLRISENPAPKAQPQRQQPSQSQPATPTATPSGPKKKPLVIIDPGHGGQDPGAKGANGVYEKQITLAVAKRLKNTLEESGRYRVKMTRESDVFVQLRDRVRFARRNSGDLFISIHADSISRPNVTGASVYTLSEKASDAETAKLVARENAADLIVGIDMSDQDQDVANILIDLMTRDTMDQSKFMANTVVTRLNRGQVRTLSERPHRSAGFAVLKAPDIPSILVEMGYVTNPAEATKLSSPAYQQKIADALKSSVDAFFEKVSSYGQ